jgi:methyl-accepting chemotaxis protein
MTMWTFGRRIAAGFTLSFLLLVGIGTVAYRTIETLTSANGLVTHTHVVLEHIAAVLGLLTDAETGERGYIITGEEAYLEPYRHSIASLEADVKDLRELTADNSNQQKRLADAQTLIDERLRQFKETIDLRRAGGIEAAGKAILTGTGKRTMDQLRGIMAEMGNEENSLLKRRLEEVQDASSRGRSVLIYGTLLCLLLVTAAGLIITRSLQSQIGIAVQHVQSSSSELQAAASQQASGSRETATAMNEISTTISELLTTSRQIAESARRVSMVAEDTAGAARGGDQLVEHAHDSVTGIKRQVDVIVAHMLDLGKKSQQIGGILELVSELAEQTNILAINASIEAAGAGDSGKRFAVVAEEIRRLADRVTGSTKDVRALIDEIRAAVNATIMATEGGTKAADAGARQFGEVTGALKRIAALVGTTNEAAKEIELSTKQQSTAVEQVNLAIGNVTKASRETESSSTQTLQTANQLSGLSRELTRLIRPNAA